VTDERPSLPPGAWGLLWAILTVVLSSVFTFGWFLSSLSERVNNHTLAIAAIDLRLAEHQRLKGHPGISEQLEAANRRIDYLADDIRRRAR
jgi:hypothetical protein